MQSEGEEVFVLEGADVCSFLCGTWKRNLQWRRFGGAFELLHASNTVVKITEKNDGDGPGRLLQWRFGTDLNPETGYAMRFEKTDQTPKSEGQCVEHRVSWQFAGRECSGIAVSGGMGTAITLNYLHPSSLITVTYRVVDENTMAICIVECAQQLVPTVQHGHMFRIDSELYSGS